MAPPQRWAWRFAPSAGEAELTFFPHELHCIRCALAHASAAQLPRLVAFIEGAMRRKLEIGLPAASTLYVTTSHPAAGSPDRYNRIRLTQYVAFHRGEVPAGSVVPGLWYRESAGPPPFDQPFAMMFFAWDTATEAGDAVARFTWSAQDWRREGTFNMGEGWSQCGDATIARVLRASDDFMATARGRPKGDTIWTLTTYKQAFRLVADRTGRRPKLADVAAELGQNRKTVTTNVKQWGYTGYRDFADQMTQEN